MLDSITEKYESLLQYEELSNQIFECLCSHSNLGTVVNVSESRQEVRATMKSIYPLSSVAKFCTLDRNQKIRELDQLIRLVQGALLSMNQMDNNCTSASTLLLLGIHSCTAQVGLHSEHCMSKLHGCCDSANVPVINYCLCPDASPAFL